jgi:tRNA (adenine57-N1/adenine58-N1)-methyltransferase
MSFIASHLGLSPGARLIEAGTGSGSFTHYAARCVARRHDNARGWGWGVDRKESSQRLCHDAIGKDAVLKELSQGIDESRAARSNNELKSEDTFEVSDPLTASPNEHVGPREGRVWSFEFHAVRARKASEELEQHGLSPTVSIRHRNVIKEGFGLHHLADAVFLDLPAPWDAIDHAVDAMRQDVATRICCFSPCVEQVLKTLSALRNSSHSSKSGTAGPERKEIQWTDIETFECLNRTHLSVPMGGGSNYPYASVDDILDRLQGVEERKGRRRAMQIEKAKKERMQRLANDEACSWETNVSQSIVSEGVKQTDLGGGKRKRLDENMTDSDKSVVAQPERWKSQLTVLSRPYSEMRGHTSYLTFATLLPRVVTRQTDPTLEREREQAKRKAFNQERARLRDCERKSESHDSKALASEQ